MRTWGHIFLTPPFRLPYVTTVNLCKTISALSYGQLTDSGSWMFCVSPLHSPVSCETKITFTHKKLPEKANFRRAGSFLCKRFAGKTGRRKRIFIYLTKLD